MSQKNKYEPLNHEEEGIQMTQIKVGVPVDNANINSNQNNKAKIEQKQQQYPQKQQGYNNNQGARQSQQQQKQKSSQRQSYAYYNQPQVQVYDIFDPLYPTYHYGYGPVRVTQSPILSLNTGGIYVNQPYQNQYQQYQQYPKPRSQQQQQQQKNEPPKSIKLPQMKVSCGQCTIDQIVPGNTQVYICCMCNNMNQCTPSYGVFICGKCQTKVWYPFQTSNLIKCTKCQTVNKVPTKPAKKYIKGPSNGSKNEKKMEKRQQIILDANQSENLPYKPDDGLKIKQEQISFDEVPSKTEVQQQKNSTGQYPDLI